VPRTRGEAARRSRREALEGESVSRILRLEAENVKRLKAVSLDFTGQSLVQIRGKNKAGKSSTLDSIAYALGGKRIHPPDLIRVGQSYARVLLETDLLVVERKWRRTESGEIDTHVDVRSKDGAAQFRSPQTMLDALTSRFWDPIAWINLPGPKQAEVLRDLIGVDFALLDGTRQKHYEKRTEINRELLALKKRLEAMPLFTMEPTPVDVTALLAERSTNAAAVAEHKERARDLTAKKTSAAEHLAKANAKVKEAEAALSAAYAARVKAEEAECQAAEAVEKFTAVAAPVDRSAELDPKIAGATEQNMKVARFKELSELKTATAAAEASSNAETSAIEAIDKQVSDAIKQAQFPVAGLGFTSAGVTLNGLPLSQASQAEAITLACAIGFALSPELRVLLVRQGSLIDEDGVRLLGELAEKHDGQIILESVGSAGVGILIVDGEVLSITDADGTTHKPGDPQ
jgi:hypothetical protein